MENNTHKKSISFPSGFGKFPYVIFKAGHAIYKQIPIHFNVENEDVENYPSTHVNGIDKKLIKLYTQNKSSPIHDILIEHCGSIKKKTELDKDKTVRLCLVESENSAHYFKENSDFQSASIPKGSTLVTQTLRVIGMGSDHFTKSSEV